MTQQFNEAGLEVREGSPGDLTVEQRHVDTMVVDSVVGFVTVGGLPRITLGEVTYKAPNELPRYVPVVTLAVTQEALRFLAVQFNHIAQQMDGATGDVADDQPAA